MQLVYRRPEGRVAHFARHASEKAKDNKAAEDDGNKRGYTPLICIVFERAHLPALVMPVTGLAIVVVLLIGRRGFSVT